MPGYELIGREEESEILDVFTNGGVLFRHGFENMRNGVFKVREFETEFSLQMGATRCLALSSGTAALRVALAALEIGDGDEVITQAFTFVATVEAIIESGAQPVICEIDATLNLDPDRLAELINERTKAVIVVHMLGTSARLREILEICYQHSIPVIEDTAWGCGGSYLGKPLGTWGEIGAFSFDHAKAITTGEGGMLCFRSSQLYERAAAWHDHGHENNPALPRWEDSRSSSGFNFRMSELQGAVGLAQLRKLPQIVESQRSNYGRMWQAVRDFDWLTERESPSESVGSADALVVLAKTAEQALACRKELLVDGLNTKILPEATSWHFAGRWSHMKLLQERYESLETSFPASQELLSRAVALPVNVEMPDDMPNRIRAALSRVEGN